MKGVVSRSTIECDLWWKVCQLQTRSFPISIASNHDHRGKRNDVKIENDQT